MITEERLKFMQDEKKQTEFLDKLLNGKYQDMFQATEDILEARVPVSVAMLAVNELHKKGMGELGDLICRSVMALETFTPAERAMKFAQMKSAIGEGGLQ